MGLEADATSWFVLRTSLTQNVLLATTKISPPAGAADTNVDANSTVAALGGGFKFGKLMLDFAAKAGTSGSLSLAGFGTNASLTYVF